MPAPDYSAPPAGLCAQYWHRVMDRRYLIRNDNFAGLPECLATRQRGPGFTVTRTVTVPVGKVIAFPSIFAGCTWGLCSPRSRFPVRASRLQGAVTSWRIRTAGAQGTWNAAYDLWLFRHRDVSGQATGAELMIWLRQRGLYGVPRHTPVLRIDGARWWLLHWRASRIIGGRKATWTYIQFRRVRQADHVTRLRLYPFIRAAEARGLASRWWWLSAIAAGFEIWSGGRGLATGRFRAHP
jgi:cellulose 1,4-beta-cellobiosidase